MLEPAMFLGIGAVAVRLYVVHPRLRPDSLPRAAAHVALSFSALSSVPAVLGLLLPRLPSHALLPYIAVALLIPYVFVSWVWVIARILHDLGGTPRGGHPVSAASAS